MSLQSYFDCEGMHSDTFCLAQLQFPSPEVSSCSCHATKQHHRLSEEYVVQLAKLRARILELEGGMPRLKQSMHLQCNSLIAPPSESAFHRTRCL